MFVVISITPILCLAMISLLNQPIYANECQAFITTSPSSADVYVGGNLIGQSPILHFVGFPFSADIRVEMKGFETCTQHIDVELDEHKQVNAVLTPLEGVVTVTTTVSTIVTTTITAITTAMTTTTAITIATTTIVANTITITSAVTTASTLIVTSTTKELGTTITSKVTE